MKIGWWNTKLVPYRKREASSQALDASFETVEHLVRTGCSLIALGEVSTTAVTGLVDRFRAAGHDSWTEVQSEQRGLALLFDSSYTRVGPDVTLRLEGRPGAHAAWILPVASTQWPEHELRLSLLHWRTDEWQGQVAREECARLLKDYLGRKAAPTVVMGDFNCEPFDEEVTRHLGATRDGEVVLSGRAPFFNPFWVARGSRPWGTLRLKQLDQRQSTFWKLVDFAVVDASIFRTSRLIAEVVAVREMTSDHRPVILDMQLGVPEEGARS